MKSRFFSFCSILSFFLVTYQAAFSVHARAGLSPVVLADKNTSPVIVIDKKLEPDLKDSLADLERCLEKMTGKQTYPDKYVAMYAYAGNSAPPNIKGHPRVIIFVATAFVHGGFSVDELINGWSEKVSQIGVRTYYNVLLWHNEMPRWQIDVLRKTLPYYYAKKVKGISAESSNNWGPEGMNYYIASQLMWNVNANVNDLISDYYKNCWHEVAPVMKRYFERWKKGKKMTSRNLALAYRDLNEAADLVRNNAEILARVNMLRLYLHWVVLYRRHTASTTSEERVKTAREAMHFSWKIARTNMVHSYAHFRELRFWQLGNKTPKQEIERWKTSDRPPPKAVLKKDDGLLGQGDDDEALNNMIENIETKKVEKTVEQPRGPVFTPAEIEKMAREDVKTLPPPAELKDISYSKQLLPARDTGIKIPDIKDKDYSPIYRSTNWYAVYSPDRKPIKLKLRIGRGQSSRLKYFVYSMENRSMVITKGETELKAGADSELEIDVPKSRTFSLILQAGGNAVRVYPVSGYCNLIVSTEYPAHLFGGSKGMYFYVPKGVKQFAIGLTTPDKHGAITVFGPNDEQVFSRQGNFVTGEEFIIDVPAGSAGRIWHYSIRKCEDATGLYLLGVPPYCTPDPSQLLVTEKGTR